MSPSYIVLNNDIKIPQIGLGTWNLEGRIKKPLAWALEVGYRHFDTAKIYNTEADIGTAVKNSAVPREQIFITTKLWKDDQGYRPALAAIDRSLTTLKMDYVDLYLIHWPYEEGADAALVRKETWWAMERIYEMGKAKAIGISNYELKHLIEMDEYATIPPAVNQIELHPFFNRKELVQYCHEHQIAVTAYAPLTRGYYFRDMSLVKIAKAHKKSVARILLRWNVQHGNVVIPKSHVKEHIVENFQIFDFELTEGEMKEIDDLDVGDSVVD